MASSGPLGAGTGAEETSLSGVTVSNPGNITAEDGTNATANLGTSPNFSNYVKATNFGFAIPSGATIDGIVVEWKIAQTLNYVIDYAIRIVKGGTIGSTNKGRGLVPWPAALAYVSFGASNDLWGTTWTDSDINGSTFGAVIAGTRFGGASPEMQVDHCRITVHYTDAGGGGSQSFQSCWASQSNILIAGGIS